MDPTVKTAKKRKINMQTKKSSKARKTLYVSHLPAQKNLEK